MLSLTWANTHMGWSNTHAACLQRPESWIKLNKLSQFQLVNLVQILLDPLCFHTLLRGLLQCYHYSINIMNGGYLEASGGMYNTSHGHSEFPDTYLSRVWTSWWDYLIAEVIQFATTTATTTYSLVPRLWGKRAWYLLFAHALNYSTFQIFWISPGTSVLCDVTSQLAALWTLR